MMTSSVCIGKVSETLAAAVAHTLEQAGLPARLTGESVLLKPNLFEPLAHTTGQTTSPHLVEAVIRCCQQRGAGAVTVGEGPSYFTADHALRDCFTKTGIAEVCRRCGIPWILFDEHPYRTFTNLSPHLPAAFSISEHAFIHDRIINIPVPKTHYLTAVSIAMKNLKGFVKREDKPLFHRVGLDNAVVALNALVRPFLNLADFTATPQHQAGFILAGRDIVAVDSVSSALMGMDPEGIATIRLGHQAGLGEMDLARIDIRGDDIKGLTMHYELPSRWLERTFPGLTITGSDRACSGCIIPLFASLNRLAAEGRVFRHPLTIMLGNGEAQEEAGVTLAIGDCNLNQRREKQGAGGCPPDRENIFEALVGLTEPGG